MKYSDIVRYELERARKGQNLGIPHRFERLSKYVPSWQKGTYYLIGAESGVGKSAFFVDAIESMLDWYIKNKNNTDIKLDLNIFSFEIKIKDILAKLICKRIYEEHKILLDINMVYEKGTANVLPDEIRKIIDKYLDYFDEIQDYLTIYDTPINPTGIYKIIKTKALKNGKEDKSTEGRTIYTPNNPNLFTMWGVDHVVKAAGENNNGVYLEGKSKIDKLSEYAVICRNTYDHSFIFLQQLNRQLGSSQRTAKLTGKVDGEEIKIQSDDFKETGNTYEDADIVFGLFSPYKYKLSSYLSYDINQLGNRFRSLQVVKCRDGESDFAVPLKYIGEIGNLTELPNVPNDTVYREIKAIKKYDNSALVKQLKLNI